MLDTILSGLGLTPPETRLYVEMLETGPMTAGELAKKLGLTRPTLYGTLQRLTDKGVIQRSLRQGVRRFVAAAPEKLGQLFTQQIEALQAQQSAYESLLPMLKAKGGMSALSPRFQLYEGVEGVQHVLNDMLLYSDCETLAMWPIKSMMEILSPEFFRYHNKERIRRNLYTRAIWPQAEAVDVAQHTFLGVGEAFRREIRIAPADMQFSMGYWMYGNKLAYLSSKAECFGFIIESREMVEMNKAQFEVIWGMSKTLTVNPLVTQGFLDEMHAGRRQARE